MVRSIRDIKKEYASKLSELRKIRDNEILKLRENKKKLRENKKKITENKKLKNSKKNDNK